MRFSEDKSVYTQIYRSGAVESVCGQFFIQNEKGELKIASLTFEDEIIKGISKILHIQQEINAPYPIAILLSLIGIRGYSMALPTRTVSFNATQPIDRDDLLLPEIIFEPNQIDNIGKLMKPVFDIIWNASDFKESFYYDTDGNWVGGR